MYVCNIMTEHGETDGYKVSDCIKELNKYVGKKFIDVVIANSKEIDEILDKGREFTREIAKKKYEDMKKKMGLFRGIEK